MLKILIYSKRHTNEFQDWADLPGVFPLHHSICPAHTRLSGRSNAIFLSVSSAPRDSSGRKTGSRLIEFNHGLDNKHRMKDIMIDDMSRVPKPEVLEEDTDRRCLEKKACTQRPQQLMCYCKKKKQT